MENMEYIIWLSGQEESERSRIGSKAAGFARLLGAGLPVPKAFCVCAQAYEHHLRINGLWQNMATLIEKARAMPGEARQRSLAEIRDVITRAPMDAGVAEAIGRAYAALDTPAVAVRASMKPFSESHQPRRALMPQDDVGPPYGHSGLLNTARNTGSATMKPGWPW